MQTEKVNRLEKRKNNTKPDFKGNRDNPFLFDLSMSLNCLFFMQSNPWRVPRKINTIGAILHEARVFEGTGTKRRTD